MTRLFEPPLGISLLAHLRLTPLQKPTVSDDLSGLVSYTGERLEHSPDPTERSNPREPPLGFEPRTHTLQKCCSTTELRWRFNTHWIVSQIRRNLQFTPFMSKLDFAWQSPNTLKTLSGLSAPNADGLIIILVKTRNWLREK